MTPSTLEDNITIQSAPGKLEKKSRKEGCNAIKTSTRLCLGSQLSGVFSMYLTAIVFLSILMLHEQYRTIGENSEINCRSGPPLKTRDL